MNGHFSKTQSVTAASMELFVRGEIAAVDKYFDPGYVVHLTGEDLFGGGDLIGSVVRLYRGAFPDLSIQVEVLLESKETIAWLRVMTGTHMNAFKGFPGTGKPIMWSEMVVSRFSGSRIAEEWVVTNLAERLLSARKVNRDR